VALARWAVETLLAGLIVAVLLGGGIAIGRNVERIDSLRAEAAVPLVLANKVQAWNCVKPPARPVRSVRSVRSDRSDRSRMARR
jgi:hypothetical protein